MKSWLVLLVVFVLPKGCAPGAPQVGVPAEASGVVRSGGDLLIADDAENGVYFRFRLPEDPPSVIPIVPERLERIPLVHGELALDLESIDVLGDGRVAALSERLRALVGNDGLIAEYRPPLAEFGNHGLEGLAVERHADGSSRVAVLWEGGYPEYHLLPPPLQGKMPRVSLRPFILVHDLKAGESGITVEMGNARRVIELDVPVPEGLEPEAQRFRAPDLVWHRSPKGGEDESSFIVLISSQNSSGPREYRYHWLQRFAVDGKPVGKPLDLDALAPAEFGGVNWEGLGWFEEGESLVVIHEKGTAPGVIALVVPLPQEWKESHGLPAGPTHVVLRETEYYLSGPQQARPPDGTLAAGTRVTLLRDAGSYCLVRTDQGLEAYVATDVLDANR